METTPRTHLYFTRRPFKSYYVVWKPEKEKIDIVNEIGLNRTMQYGNLGSNTFFEAEGDV